MSKPRSKKTALTALLISALTASAAVGAFTFEENRLHPDGRTDTHTPKQADGSTPASFTTADAGSCLNWQVNNGKTTDFEQASCDAEHRFEVSLRTDLSSYPTAEFAAEAPLPSMDRQVQLREELCLDPTMNYLEGHFDPLGKYSVSSILPPAEAWKAGDRTMLCGVQATDEQGTALPTVGRAKDADQSRVFEVGQCVVVSKMNSAQLGDCAAPHQLETTAVIDLLPVFPEGVPTADDQDEHLEEVCTQAARDYLGGDDALYYSTLQPFWTTVSEESWLGGSHKVNCSLIYANDDASFATLAGSAKSKFTINGNPPASRPARSPIVNPEVLESFEKSPSTSTESAAPEATEEAVAPAVTEEPAPTAEATPTQQ